MCRLKILCNSISYIVFKVIEVFFKIGVTKSVHNCHLKCRKTRKKKNKEQRKIEETEIDKIQSTLINTFNEDPEEVRLTLRDALDNINNSK